ncbi:MAG: signal peptidase II [Alistipes sp.]|nr:signal peptidase II [Candidatus Alistipes equi]
MKVKHITIIILILIILDQILKIWVKTHMHLYESITVFDSWFQLKFVENNGAAFGMQFLSHGTIDWGKLCLSLFRIGLVSVLIYYLFRLCKKKAPAGVIIAFGMIIAGAIGNIIDSAFYGMIFSQSTAQTVAHIGGHYSSFMFGKVVDMFYFPLFRWIGHPAFLDFLFDYDGYFFGAIFNLADSYICVAITYMIIFQHKYFK